ncbi:MAG TPA: phosphate/phosphite/phosphonate ABC transporter substrate-binding protein [Egibacteraceae bacterium]|nr:phosphate/phosphite/phosphonate ABC transporter substrate-binding protein [Egibacteraceae bacterium]
MRRHTVAVVALAVLAGACASAGAGSEAAPDGQPRLRVGLIPNVAPEQQRARYEPFGAYLEDGLGVDVELFVATNYTGVVTALASDRLDVAYLGGLTYVQAEQQVDLVPLVTEVDRQTNSREYLSAIVVADDAPYRSLADLVAAGGSFAFGDVSSTSGSLYPRLMLVQAGARCSPRDLLVCPPLSDVRFTGGHDASAQAVLSGAADAAGLELRILRRLEREGAVPAGALRVLEQRRVMGYPWVARAAVDSPTRERIVAAFEAIDDPALLDLLRAERYARISPSDYDEIRRHAAELGLLSAAAA